MFGLDVLQVSVRVIAVSMVSTFNSLLIKKSSGVDALSNKIITKFQIKNTCPHYKAKSSAQVP